MFILYVLIQIILSQPIGIHVFRVQHYSLYYTATPVRMTSR